MPLTTQTQLANLALAKIGARRIASLEGDSSEEARQCRLHFEHKRDTLLRRHQWNFAKARVALSRLTDDPVSEWGAAWQLPADLVRHIRIVGADRDIPVTSYEIEGRKLLCDITEDLGIVYVSNAKPVNEWDSLFVDALVLQLAAELAGPIAQNPAQAADLLTQFERLALPAAETADAREVLSGENFGPRQLAATSSLVAARFAANGRPPYIPTASP